MMPCIASEGAWISTFRGFFFQRLPRTMKRVNFSSHHRSGKKLCLGDTRAVLYFRRIDRLTAYFFKPLRTYSSQRQKIGLKNQHNKTGRAAKCHECIISFAACF